MPRTKPELFTLKIIEIEEQVDTLKRTLQLLQDEKIEIKKLYRLISNKILAEYDPQHTEQIIKDEIERLQAWKRKLQQTLQKQSTS